MFHCYHRFLMSVHLLSIGVVLIAAATLQQLPNAVAAGYHYERPSAVGGPFNEMGRYYAPLPTVVPLPPLPTLPALPTPRSNVRTHQSLVQIHPPTKLNFVDHNQPATRTFIGSPKAAPLVQPRQRQTQSQQLLPTPRSKGIAQLYRSPSSNTYRNYNTPASSQQSNNYYTSNGRQLKQYAVYEEIDNDIEPLQKPYLTPFFDAFRASIGASGTGALATNGISSRQYSYDDGLQRAQQAILQQQQPTAAVALGSGGLGYIQLPNGQVYLGSGSLGYISSDQRLQLAKDARTRSGAPMPDPLHFGHGPLGGMGLFPFK